MPNRFLTPLIGLTPLIALSLASLTACTAIVLGQLSDTADFPVDAGATSTSSSSGTSGTSGGNSDAEVVDRCNLRYNPSGEQYTYPKTPCSDCIEAQCKSQLTASCTNGDGIDGYETVKACAKDPWQEYSLDGHNSSWACKQFETRPSEVIGETDSAKIYRLKLCLHEQCLQGAEPACKRCEVNIKEKSATTLHFLKDDRCGSCMEKCKPTLVKCCDSYPVADFIEKCAFTDDIENKNLCKLIEFADGGPNKNSYQTLDKECLTELSTCWKVNCKTKPECQ